jgi:hypothetical protein
MLQLKDERDVTSTTCKLMARITYLSTYAEQASTYM